MIHFLFAKQIRMQFYLFSQQRLVSEHVFFDSYKLWIFVTIRRFVARTYMCTHMCTYPAGCSKRESRNTGQAILFYDKCLGFFYVHYTTHRTYMYSFTSHPKDEAIMLLKVSCSRTQALQPTRPGFEPTF